jgi:tetratricopeptide (TPR) repeat protein
MRGLERFKRFQVEGALLLCAFGLALCVHGVNRVLEAWRVEGQPSGRVGPLPDGHALRVLSLGFDRLLADLFWLRTIYYIGDEHTHAAGYPDVDRLANLVTDIDPTLQVVYVTMSGAIGGLKGDPDGAIALLEKGVHALDPYWKLHFLLGFNYFIEKQDYTRAAAEMKKAGERGGPPYLPLLAARLYANAGDPETALAFIQARLAEEKQADTRAALERRYRDLWIARDLARIDQAIAAYKEHAGRQPQTMAELIRSGALEREPRDPRGGPYRIEAGHAATDLEHEVLKMNMPYWPSATDIERQYRRLRAASGELQPAEGQER